MNDEPRVAVAASLGAPDARRSGSRRRWIIAVGIAAVAVVLVAGSLSSSGAFASKHARPAASASSQVKQGDPNKVAVAGTPLARVVDPPVQTHVMISLPAGTPELGIAITFEPYGLTPEGGLVVRVSKASPVGDNADAARLAKRLSGSNLVVRRAATLGADVSRGGKYEGTVKTVADKGAFAFTLTNAKAVR